jgi:hypothetical protein
MNDALSCGFDSHHIRAHYRKLVGLDPSVFGSDWPPAAGGKQELIIHTRWTSKLLIQLA